MNAIAQWLKEKGKIVIPKTLDTQVFDENGKSLDRRLKTAKDEQVIQLPKVDPTMIFSDLDYSTEEQLTGRRWIDGKPIYQKTIELGTLPIGPSTIAHNIDNLEMCVYSAASVERSQYGRFMLPFASVDANWLALFVGVNSNNMTFDIGRGIGAQLTNAIATILYTKTTDTASSPVALPNVEAKHVYSTEEKVVGTWIDGKPLYEKTIVYDGIVKTDTKIYQNESIDEIVNVSNKCFYDTLFNEWNTEITSTYNLGITARGYYLQGEVNSEYGDRITKCRCTIQYTKTTDTATT